MLFILFVRASYPAATGDRSPGMHSTSAHECIVITPRLVAARLSSPALRDFHRSEVDLATIAQAVLTPAVTEALPGPWRGEYTRDRATRGAEDTEKQGTVLVVVDKASHSCVGMVVLMEFPLSIQAPVSGSSTNEAMMEVRVGYMLRQNAWGRGLATELLQGIVQSFTRDRRICCLVGGVDGSNVASARVLQKAGFTQVQTSTCSAEHLEFHIIL